MELTQLNNLVDIVATKRKLKENLKSQVDLKRQMFEDSISSFTEEIDSLAEEIEATQSEILEALTESGNKSWKTEKATVSVKQTPESYTIVDKQAVFDWLKKKKLSKKYTTLELSPDLKHLFPTTAIEGVQKNEGRSYISVLVKKDEDQQAVQPEETQKEFINRVRESR